MKGKYHMNEVVKCLNTKTAILEDLNVSYLVKKKWRNIVGDVLAKSLWFNYIKQDQCIISINNSCWFSEILLYEKTILEKLNTIIVRKQKIKMLKLVMSTDGPERKKRQYAVRKNYDNMIGR